MQTKAKEIRNIDIRIRILLLLIISLTALLLKTEFTLLVCLILAAIYISITSGIKKVMPYIITYFALWALLYLLKDIRVLGNLPLLTVYVRRLMVPVMMAVPVIGAPTGQLIASLNRMKLPKYATLSLAVLFRFMPTIIREYHAIREAQRFRGIGVSLGKTLLSLPRTLEYIMMPMLIRTSKVADELTASAQVRGVKIEGECSSYHIIKMKISDWIFLMAGIASVILLFMIEKD